VMRALVFSVRVAAVVYFWGIHLALTENLHHTTGRRPDIHALRELNMAFKEATANTHQVQIHISCQKPPQIRSEGFHVVKFHLPKATCPSGPPEALRVIMSHNMTIDAGKQETAAANDFQRKPTSFSGAVTVIRPQDLNNQYITNPQEAIKPWDRK
jgi:hypothetical protein